MEIDKFVEAIDADFYTGVPDSQLKELCNYLLNTYGIDPSHHVIAANEGNCVAIAAGYYLATGRVPVIYMQNSGEGNVINPIASLLNDKVCAIPVIFIIGWRGEPCMSDEPQHIYQGKVTLKLLRDMDIRFFIVDKATDENAIKLEIDRFQENFAKGKSFAFVVRKDVFNYDKKIEYKNEYTITREDAIKHIVHISGNDPIVSTTGKISRELYEIREANGKDHQYDFLTVGSMGHSSSIALGIAVNKPKMRIWCIDGDGAVLMHMGAMAVIGAISPKNLIHVVINNEAHESVGGLPTVAKKNDLVGIAKACGYSNVVSVNNIKDLDRALCDAKKIEKLSMIEIKCSISSRKDLGRPTYTPLENRISFMEYLKKSNP